MLHRLNKNLRANDLTCNYVRSVWQTDQTSSLDALEIDLCHIHSQTKRCVSALQPQMGVWSSLCSLQWPLAKNYKPKENTEKKGKWDTCAKCCNVRVWPRIMRWVKGEGMCHTCYQEGLFSVTCMSTYCSEASTQKEKVSWIHAAFFLLQSTP